MGAATRAVAAAAAKRDVLERRLNGHWTRAMTAAKRFDPEAVAYSAIENASRMPIDRAGLRAILATGEGDTSHVRALFGDVSLSTLLRLAMAFGISDGELALAYGNARKNHVACQPDLDRFAAELGLVPEQTTIS